MKVFKNVFKVLAVSVFALFILAAVPSANAGVIRYIGRHVAKAATISAKAVAHTSVNVAKKTWKVIY